MSELMPQISLDDGTLDRLRREGEVKVEEAHGIPLVVMTVEARKALQQPQTLAEWTTVYEGLSDEQIGAVDAIIKSRANLTRNLS